LAICNVKVVRTAENTVHELNARILVGN